MDNQIKKAWEAGAASAYECTIPEGPCRFNYKQHKQNKKDYFDVKKKKMNKGQEPERSVATKLLNEQKVG